MVKIGGIRIGFEALVADLDRGVAGKIAPAVINRPVLPIAAAAIVRRTIDISRSGEGTQREPPNDPSRDRSAPAVTAAPSITAMPVSRMPPVTAAPPALRRYGCRCRRQACPQSKSGQGANGGLSELAGHLHLLEVAVGWGATRFSSFLWPLMS